MYKYYATQEQVKETHDRVAKYKYWFLRKLHKFTHISYTRLSRMLRADRLTYPAYADIKQACIKFEAKFNNYIRD